jgi:4-hydroxybenzoate polyprenyltransferase
MSESDRPRRSRKDRAPDTAAPPASKARARKPAAPRTPAAKTAASKPATPVRSPRAATRNSVSPAAADAPGATPPRSRTRKTPAPAAPDAEPLATPSFARPATARRTRAPAASSVHPADASLRSTRVLTALLARVPPAHRARLRDYLVLARLDRPVGALLLLWPTWWALWLAAGDFPPPGLLLVFTLGVFVMRSAGCVINDYADHGWLDPRVERTRGRPMAAGRVSRREALLLFAGLLLMAFVLVLFTNALTIKLSFAGVALAAVYPFTKRVTHLAQVVLGAAFGWSIPMAFAAVGNSLPPLCWLLFLGNVLFSTLYDTEYAMVDRDEDIEAGAKSTAILFGDADRGAIGVLMAMFLLAMLLVGTRATLAWPYFAGVAIAACLFAWQQWLIRDRSREHCFAAFRNNNWIGFVLWLGLLLALAVG